MRHDTVWTDDPNPFNEYLSILKVLKHYITKMYMYFYFQRLIFIVLHFCNKQLVGFFLNNHYFFFYDFWIDFLTWFNTWWKCALLPFLTLLLNFKIKRFIAVRRQTMYIEVWMVFAIFWTLWIIFDEEIFIHFI